MNKLLIYSFAKQISQLTVLSIYARNRQKNNRIYK